MSSNPEVFSIKGKGIYIITDPPTWKGMEITVPIPGRRETGSASYKELFCSWAGIHAVSSSLHVVWMLLLVGRG